MHPDQHTKFRTNIIVSRSVVLTLNQFTTWCKNVCTNVKANYGFMLRGKDWNSRSEYTESRHVIWLISIARSMVCGIYTTGRQTYLGYSLHMITIENF